ncbi:hypothetical protein, conserved [Babesia bigemina]|uniref:AP2/ERF domain-containing protein n=1 Tax=Babesia bigemina TaxID=5866 RepID=A0A061D8B1_BABBI|nr:hypothetical protein, conserved [Babesia bigemina]CDR96217.1 hypothetical protein, conserved [Babesia bigemina]|eukprot:XP_012768403.1 hypothetical protein, conserved [Babesia bigemina]
MISLKFWGGGAERFCRCFSTRSYKQGTKEVIHPYVSHPEQLGLISRYATAMPRGQQVYIPKNFYNDLTDEATRSGDFLGSDFPYTLAGKEKAWRTRKYNVLANPVPNNISSAGCVTYYHRLQVWSTHWFENGLHRSRWFKCSYGFHRAKSAAELFRNKLISFGRVDNKKTNEQIRLESEKLRSLRVLRSRRFDVNSNRNI